MVQSAIKIKKSEQGFFLAELLVAVFVLSMVGSAVLGAIVYGFQTSRNAGNVTRANFLAEEGLEAVRNIREPSFANLTDGTFGLTTTSNQWNLAGASDVNGIFTRTITISTFDTRTKQVVSRVAWTQPDGRAENVTLTTYLGNMNLATSQSACLVVNTSTATTTIVDVLNITLQNTCGTPITITQMSIGWTNALRLLSQIVINGTTVWSGLFLSNALEDITDTTIPANTTVPLTRVRFNGLLTTDSYSFIFYFSDGTNKTVTWP